MPGESVDEALAEAHVLGRAGLRTTFTLLGENIEHAHEADGVAEHYAEVLSRIASEGLDAEISVKPTQLGLEVSGSIEGACRRIGRLAAACAPGSTPGSTVWLDMESSAYVDATLALFRALRGEHDNVGLCMQAYLQRSVADLEGLAELQPSIRLVKGAYREPANVAFARKADVDRNFVALTEMLLRARAQGGRGLPQIGTHDPRMIAEAQRIAAGLGLGPGDYETTMLYGIQAAAQRRLVEQGHVVRVLISYGSAWFPWYMRRLAERPANVAFVLRQLISR